MKNVFNKKCHLLLRRLKYFSFGVHSSIITEVLFIVFFKSINDKMTVSRSQETILVFLFKHFIIYLKLLKTLRSRTLFIVADYIILISETLFLAARTF